MTLEPEETKSVPEGLVITDIGDLPGVGPATAEKLKEAGYGDMMSIAVASPSDLAEAADLVDAITVKTISAARKLTHVGGFQPGGRLPDRRTRTDPATRTTNTTAKTP